LKNFNLHGANFVYSIKQRKINLKKKESQRKTKKDEERRRKKKKEKERKT
jgi:hypothetical protein